MGEAGHPAGGVYSAGIALVLIEGRVDVVDADALGGPDCQGAMVIATRAGTEPDRHTLDELAAHLDANITNLGARSRPESHPRRRIPKSTREATHSAWSADPRSPSRTG